MADLKCAICDKNFQKRIVDLMKHYFERHVATYLCRFCTDQFRHQAALDDHISKDHKDKSFYACLSCRRHFPSEKILQAHYEEDHREQKALLYCSSCDMWFVHEKLLIRHNRYMRCNSLVTRPPFECHFCSHSFDSRDDHCSHNIVAHEAYVLCSYCEKQFRSQEECEQHLVDSHRRAKSFTCVYCWVDFGNDRLLRVHQWKSHTIFRCEKCNLRAPTADCLAMHRRYEDAKASGAAEPHQPLEGTKRKFQPDISSSANNTVNENVSPVTKKSVESPKLGHKNSENIDSMAAGQNKTSVVKKEKIKEEIVSDDSISVEQEADVRHLRVEISENSSTTPKPKKRRSESTSLTENPGPSNASNFAITSAINTNSSNDSESNLNSSSLDANLDSSNEELAFVRFHSAKVIPVRSSLNNNSAAKKTVKSYPIIPPAEITAQTPPNSLLKETRYICKLCQHSTLYKGSLKKHLEIIHRVPTPIPADLIEEKEVKITLENTEEWIKLRTVSSQCQFDCMDCAKKDETIKEKDKEIQEKDKKNEKLTRLLEKFKNTASQIDELTV